MTKRKIEYWVIPPDADGEFVAHMEAVLETYEKAYDPAQPVLCMDEQPVQLLKETRASIPATSEHPQRVDYEYERAGTASIFMFTEPLSGFRQATARPHRTEVDWAVEVLQTEIGAWSENTNAKQRVGILCRRGPVACGGGGDRRAFGTSPCARELISPKGATTIGGTAAAAFHQTFRIKLVKTVLSFTRCYSCSFVNSPSTTFQGLKAYGCHERPEVGIFLTRRHASQLAKE